MILTIIGSLGNSKLAYSGNSRFQTRADLVMCDTASESTDLNPLVSNSRPTSNGSMNPAVRRDFGTLSPSKAKHDTAE